MKLRTTERTGIMHANSPFRHLKSEVHHPVRQADTQSQSYIERARKTREMLRSMTPEKLLEVIKLRNNLTLFEALDLAKQGYLIVPNDIYDRILMEARDEVLKQLYGTWTRTGTLVIYEKPDKPFGEFVEFDGIRFSVPKQLQGKVNCALAL